MLRAITPAKNSCLRSVARNPPTSDSSASTSACESVRLSKLSQSVRRKHPSGVASDRSALDRERDVAIRAWPDVPEARADDAPSEEIRPETHVLFVCDVGEHRGRRMHGHHALLT